MFEAKVYSIYCLSKFIWLTMCYAASVARCYANMVNLIINLTAYINTGPTQYFISLTNQCCLLLFLFTSS